MGVKDSLISFIKGFILGVANIIPGVSGGTLAVSLGLYEQLLSCISGFFKDVKKNIIILMPIILGALAALLTVSKLVSMALSNYKAQTIFLFVGLISGGVSLIMRKTRGKVSFINILIFVISFALVIGISFLNTNSITIAFTNMNVIDYLLLIAIGFVASSAMIIPGISGSFVLMVMGYYDSIINTISNLTNLKEIGNLGNNLLILAPFGVGVILGLVFMAKLITKLLLKYEVQAYFAILGFVLSSVVILIYEINSFKGSFLNIITCIVTFLWGYFLARAIEKE